LDSVRETASLLQVILPVEPGLYPRMERLGYSKFELEERFTLERIKWLGQGVKAEN